MRNWKAGRQEIIDAETGDSIGATFVTLRGKKAVEEGAAAAFSMGPLWPIGIAAIGGILAAWGIASVSGGSLVEVVKI